MDNPLAIGLDSLGLLLAGALLLAYAALVIAVAVLAAMLGGLLLAGLGAWAIDALRDAGLRRGVAVLVAAVALVLLAVHAGSV